MASQDLSYRPVSRLVSPIVATREIDQTFLAQGIADIGAAIVAPFPKGPGFTPVTLTSVADFEALFGVPDGVYYGPYCVEQYLKYSNTVTIVRTGMLGGYTQKNPLVIYAQSGSMARQAGLGTFTSSLSNCTINASGQATGSVTASLIATYLSGPLSGSVFSLPVTASFVSGTVGYISGSSPKSFSSASISYNFPSSTGQYYNSVLTATVSSSVIGTVTVYNIQGNISGSYGQLLPNTFIANSSSPVVLGVIANSAYDSAQNLYGFSGSTLTPVTTASVGSDYFLALNEYDATSNTSASYGTWRVSFDSTSNSYFPTVIGTNPMAGQIPVASGQQTTPAYVYSYFQNTINNVLGGILNNGSYQINMSNGDGLYFNTSSLTYANLYAMQFNDGVPGGGGGVNNVAWSAYDLRQATTPWVNSQFIGQWSGSVAASQSLNNYNLFRFHTLSDGTYTNTEYKIEISNIKLAGTINGSDYGAFDIVVRSFDDTDTRPYVLERFSNVSLDPNSVNYIASAIGDQYSSIDYNGKVLEFGNFTNKSKYIRVEMSTAPYPVTSVPYGFDSYASPIGGKYSTNIAPMLFTSASIYSKNPGQYASGITFNPAPAGADAELSGLYPLGTLVGAELDNAQYFAPIPENSYANPNNYFDLQQNCGIQPIYSPSNEAINILMRRFVFGFQGGFDGGSPSIPILTGNSITSTNQQGLNCSSITSSGSVAYKQALAALSNADQFDINMLATPGIIYNLHPYVVTNAVQTVSNRGDAFYIFDIYQNQVAGGNAITNVVNEASQFDTNYAATYYPWVKIRDTNTNKIISVPPSVCMLPVFAQNDTVANEWNAPAGLNRGGIQMAVSVEDRLTQADRDNLYQGNVNPIASFPGQGIVAWGQKTLQAQPSALDRINVRRLLIAVKKYISSTSKYLLFEPNVQATRNKFLSFVNPYLESIVQRNGLYAFKVVMDDTNNDPSTIDRNILYGSIYLQPSRTVEFLLLDFTVLPTGATFPTD